MKFDEALKGIMAGEMWSCDGIRYWYNGNAIVHAICDEDDGWDSTRIDSKYLVSEDWMKVDSTFTQSFFEAMEEAKEGKKVTNLCLCNGHLTDKNPYYKVATDGYLRHYNRDGNLCQSSTISSDELCSKWGVLEE